MGASCRHASISGGEITFDGSNDSLKTGAFTLNQPLTYFLAVKMNAWSSGWILDGNAQFSVGISGITATPQIRAYAGSSLGNISSLAVGTYGILCAVYNGASSSFQHNLNAAITGAAGAANAGAITMGTDALGSGAFSMSVKGFGYTTQVLTAAQITQTIQAMGRRYGISV
jgi:hypothetical protein